MVSHSGGYPGFGSNMRWHPATGTGVIALGNATYAAMSALAGTVLEALLPRSAAYLVAMSPAQPGAQPGAPWPETLAATDAVNRLLQDWDDAAADALFCENVALDSPYPERRHAIGLIRDRIGDFSADRERAPESDTHGSPPVVAHRSAGHRPSATPAQPRVPAPRAVADARRPPAVGSPLAGVLESLLGWLNSGAREWPSSVAVAPGADPGLIGRRLRMAAAWAGPCVAGAYRAGDGDASVTVELSGEHATVHPVPHHQPRHRRTPRGRHIPLAGYQIRKFQDLRHACHSCYDMSTKTFFMPKTFHPYGTKTLRNNELRPPIYPAEVYRPCDREESRHRPFWMSLCVLCRGGVRARRSRGIVRVVPE